MNASKEPVSIAVAEGDGIGPEITRAVLGILDAAGAPLRVERVAMGLGVYEQGHAAGMTPEAKETIERLGILLKGPMATPKGKGVKSINVTARKVWNTFANKRVFRSLHGVDTVFSRAGIPVNITVVRENIEDTYGGIEHMLTHDVALCRRFITRPGSLQVHRYAFEMARRKGAHRVTCGHKANIMKLTDGLFLECFHEVARDYPDIRADDLIVDDLAMKLVARPDQFDVIVLPNLQGDILSDLCAGLVGGLGFAPSANIGDHISIFEAVHGTAPDIAGRDVANPTALLLSATMMLRHLGLVRAAATIENAILRTLEDGHRTADFGDPARAALGTTAFADAVVSNLGRVPGHTPPVPVPEHDIAPAAMPERPSTNRMMETPRPGQRVVGVDLFVESNRGPSEVAALVEACLDDGLRLVTISNRGTQVWPTGSVFTECIDQYRVRVEATAGADAPGTPDLLKTAARVTEFLRVCSVETLLEIDGQRAYSLAQGQ